MQEGSNEIGKEGELAVGGGASSIRKRFLKGKVRKIYYNLFQKHRFDDSGEGENSKVTGEKIITIKKEIRTKKNSSKGAGELGEDPSKLKIININGVGRNSNSAQKLSISRQNREKKNESNGKNSESNKNTITKIEIKTESRIGRNKSASNNNPSQKGGNSRTTKATETTKTTITNQKSQGLRTGNQRNQVNEGNRGRTTQSKVTTTKTTTTTVNGRGGKQMTSSQSVVAKNTRTNGGNNKNPTTTNQRGMIPQKSTPALRGNKALNKPKDDKKIPLSKIPQEVENRDNIKRITIDDTGKIPKKEYVLNVRKTDIIRRKNRMRMVYNNDPNTKNPLISDFNHNVKIVRNVSKDLPTVDSLPIGTKIIHRYNYSYNPNVLNTSTHVIDETGKIPKKEVVVSPRKISIIKTERKPLKMSIENYNNTNPNKMKLIPLPNKISDRSASNFRGKNEKTNNKITSESRRTNVKTDSKVGGQTTTTTTTTTTRNKSRAGDRNKGSETTTTTKVTETRTTRGRAEGGNPIGKSGESKTITKTTETRTRTTGGKAEDKSNRGNKNQIQSITNTGIEIKKSGNKRNRSDAGDRNGQNGSRLRGGIGNQSGNKEETKVTTKTTTTRTTTTKVETSEGGDGNATKVRKIRSQRNLKK